MPTWDEFAWAAFLYGAIGGDRDYQGLMSQTQFLNSLMTNPMKLQVNQIQQQLIKGFLNRWKCRVQNTPQSAGSIQTTLHNLLPYLQVLDNFTIKNLRFTQMVNVNNNQMKVRQVIEHSYTNVRSIGYRLV